MPLSFRPELGPSRPARRVAVVWLILLPLLTVPLFAACSEETDQSAVQPGQVLTGHTPTTNASIAFVTPPGVSIQAASPTTLTALLPTSTATTSQPAPSRVYFIHGGDLWQIPFGPGDAAPVIGGKSILAFAPSPTGEQVAVVYFAPESGKEHLADLKPDGTSVVDVELSLPIDQQAAHGGDIQSIAWAPSGDRVAVARQDGSVLVVTPDGAISHLVSADPRRFPGALSFSSDGQLLLFLDPDLPGRATSLYAVPVAGGPARKLVDGTATGHPVLQAHWLPGGTVIAYEQAVAASPSSSGDVFTIDAATRDSRLVIPSAQFAPVAGIGDFAFSPDGHWVAFSLFVPDDSNVRFQGLWLMNLSSGVSRQIDTAENQTVTDLWWGANSLMFRTITSAAQENPQHYTGIEPYWLYAVSTSGDTPVQRYQSP